MTLENIVNQVNRRLAGETFIYPDLVDYFDSTIDDINTRLNTKFPVFSDLTPGATEYTALPDKYLRTVVVPGVVFKFYTTDEEGAMSAPKFEEEYHRNIFYMERDYIELVPEEYIDDLAQGRVHMTPEHPLSDGGIVLNGGIFSI